MKPVKKLSGEEMDAFSIYARKIIKWKPGQRASIKRRYRRRVRAFLKILDIRYGKRRGETP